jgi:hypothetical protein
VLKPKSGHQLKQLFPICLFQDPRSSLLHLQNISAPIPPSKSPWQQYFRLTFAIWQWESIGLPRPPSQPPQHFSQEHLEIPSSQYTMYASTSLFPHPMAIPIFSRPSRHPSSSWSQPPPRPRSRLGCCPRGCPSSHSAPDF